MGFYDEEVKKRIGREEWSLILDAVQSGEIGASEMRDIAQNFGRNVGGSHRGRKKSDDYSHEAEMREILSDWYKETIFAHKREKILTDIIKILRDPSVSLNPLAKKLEQCLEVTRVIGQDVWDIIFEAIRSDIIQRKGINDINKWLKTGVPAHEQTTTRDMMMICLKPGECPWAGEGL